MATRYHLYDPNTDTHYRNGGFINPDNYPMPDGMQMVADPIPEGATVYKALSRDDVLMQQYEDLSLPVRAAFAPVMEAVEGALRRGDYALAKEIINQQTVPEELKNQKAAMLAAFG